MPGLDPQTLERLRRGVPLRMTARGELRFDEGPITHPRVQQALRAGIDLSDGGEPIVRLGAQWCYLTIDDCPLRATAVTRNGDRLSMRVDDGREVPLSPQALWDEPELGLRTSAPAQGSGRPLAVRFTNRAQMDLAHWLEPGEGDDTVLVLGEQRWTIPTEDPAAASPG
ncbi:MAG: hypothetical protein AAF799_31295 [Myxococcota bacterium]